MKLVFKMFLVWGIVTGAQGRNHLLLCKMRFILLTLYLQYIIMKTKRCEK